jgi:DNA-binding NtrC family response regulator
MEPEAMEMLQNYEWPGNIRQLKNVTEQISVIEHNRVIDKNTLKKYLPDYVDVKLPALFRSDDARSFASEREILYKVLFDMKNDVNDLKKLVLEMIKSGKADEGVMENNAHIIKKLYNTSEGVLGANFRPTIEVAPEAGTIIQDTEEIVEENLSLAHKEMELIKKALEKHNGKRRNAAQELGISERTLYRKIKEYNLA